MIEVPPHRKLTGKSWDSAGGMMLFVELLGTLSVRGDTGPVPLAARQKRPLGLLAILALGGKQGLSRQRIEAYLWSESPAARARHALDQAVYTIRHALGSDVILSTGHELQLNAACVRADVWDFDDAIRTREWTTAAGLYKGTLLRGFHVGDSRELETWIDTERARLLRDYQGAVEWLADRAAESGDHAQGVTWWRTLADSDPFSAGPAKKLILALAAAGDRAGAVKHAREYQKLVRQELEMEPDAAIEELALALSRPQTNETAAATAPRRAPAFIPPPPPDIAAAPPPRSRVATLAMLATYAVVAASVIIALLLTSARGSDPSPDPTADDARRAERAPLPAARQAYDRGLTAWDDRTKEGLDEAVAFFRRATELDPQFADAYAHLAEAYTRIGYFGYRPAEAMFPKAKAAALHSMQLDSTIASAHIALATVLVWEHDFAGAESEYQRAIALAPANATAHQWHGVLLMIIGNRAEAVAAERRAAALEPLSLQVQNNYGAFLNCAGDHVAALRQFQKTMGEEPDSAWVHRNPWVLSNMARVYGDNGQHDIAIRMMNRALEIVPRSPRAAHTMAAIYQNMGRHDLARQAYARADTSNEQYPAYLGMLYAGEGKSDSAFLSFDRAETWGVQPMLSLQCERHVDPIRSDPRFKALLTRLGIPARP